jgi:hypothetical protein
MSLQSCYVATERGGGGYSDTPLIRQTALKMLRPTILLFHVFVAAETYLPSCCLAKKGGIHFTEPLPSNDKRNTQTDGRDL